MITILKPIQRVKQFASGAAMLLLSLTAATAESRVPIDRHALVTRHKISWDKLAGRLPLESHVTEAALGEF